MIIKNFLILMGSLPLTMWIRPCAEGKSTYPFSRCISSYKINDPLSWRTNVTLQALNIRLQAL